MAKRTRTPAGFDDADFLSVIKPLSYGVLNTLFRIYAMNAITIDILSTHAVYQLVYFAGKPYTSFFHGTALADGVFLLTEQ